ncbi:hypothetical protein, partial [Xanthomonas euvesicatoria]
GWVRPSIPLWFAIHNPSGQEGTVNIPVVDLWSWWWPGRESARMMFFFAEPRVLVVMRELSEGILP